MDDGLTEKIEELEKEFGLDDRCRATVSDNSDSIEINHMSEINDRLKAANEALTNALVFTNKEINRLNEELERLKSEKDWHCKQRMQLLDDYYAYRRIIEKLIADRDQKKAEIKELKTLLSISDVENRVLKNEDILTGSVGDEAFMKMDENNDE